MTIQTRFYTRCSWGRKPLRVSQFLAAIALASEYAVEHGLGVTLLGRHKVTIETYSPTFGRECAIESVLDGERLPAGLIRLN